MHEKIQTLYLHISRTQPYHFINYSQIIIYINVDHHVDVLEKSIHTQLICTRSRLKINMNSPCGELYIEPPILYKRGVMM